MYVIMDEEGKHVFKGFSPNLRAYWEPVERMAKEKEGFQLMIFKDTASTIKVLADHGVTAVEYRLTKLLDELE